jgi:uncharacterized membrane protein
MILASNWLLAVRVPLGLFLVLVLPGYVTTLALFPRRTLGIPERAALSLGLSLVIGAFGVLVLNATPRGIDALSWLLFLAAITALAGVCAHIRRYSGGTGSVPPRAPRIGTSQALLFGLALMIALTAGGVSYASARHQPSAGFTQLWLLPAGGGDPTLRIGIESHESTTTQYLLKVAVAGQVALEWPSLTLQPNGRWETTAALPANLSSVGTIEAVLYRADKPDVIYRRVALTS